MKGSVLALLIFSVLVLPAVAFFSFRMRWINNTFSSGHVALRFFYDCQSPGNLTDVVEDVYQGEDPGVIINCPPQGDGSDEVAALPEREALFYSEQDGATIGRWQPGDSFNLENDWTSTNGWWTAASSVLDHTLVGPLWGIGSSTPTHDWVSVGNAGDYPITLAVELKSESVGDSESVLDSIIEPLDGIFSHPHGGDAVDPATDETWMQSRRYDTRLAEKIEVTVERVTYEGIPIAGTQTTLPLAAAFTQTIALGKLAVNEVGYIQFTWKWISDDTDNDYQNMIFDYSVEFTSGVTSDE